MGFSRTVLDLKDSSRTKSHDLGLALAPELALPSMPCNRMCFVQWVFGIYNTIQYNTIQCNTKFALKNWQTKTDSL